MEYRIVSADDHIDMPWLPQDLWQKRVPAAWRERAPRVVDTPEGPYWVCGEARWDAWGGRKGAAGAMGGRRLALERGGVLEPGVLRPTTTALRLADMDRDGVDATVTYGPIVPLLIEDPELRRVCYRAYNDWLAEFCATAPERLIGAGLIPIDDARSAADEVRHLKQLRLRTGMFLAASVTEPLWDEAWEPLWEAAAETGIVIGFHLGGYLLERLDDTYDKFLDAAEFWKRNGGLALTMEPSRYFTRQVWATFQTEHAGLRMLDVLGDDRVMWASDYPHADSTWPESAKAIEDNFKDVPTSSRRRILCDSARTLYGL
jgi:predicted TIM-barrel fold metal-dependent hydrolase